MTIAPILKLHDHAKKGTILLLTSIPFQLKKGQDERISIQRPYAVLQEHDLGCMFDQHYKRISGDMT
jgi:hypothetical protein